MNIIQIDLDALHPKIANTIKTALALQNKLNTREKYTTKIHPFTILRKSLGITQTEFAASLGVSNTLISLIENGKRNCPDELLILAADLYDHNLIDQL